MGWETRRGTGRYYTRSRRIAGRVTREYVGTGSRAEYEAMSDLAARAELKRQNAEWGREKASIAEAESSLIILQVACTAVTRSALESAGYRQHARGAWRKQRGTVRA
jgi:hypothetical protein